MQKSKAVFNWSGGKDSALALQKVLRENEFEIIALLTTFNEADESSSAHSVPLNLMEKQAEAIGIELFPIFINKSPNDYEIKMLEAVEHFKEKGVAHFIFGDLYLDEIRTYRESKLNPHGIEVVEPIWGQTADQTIQDFLNSGFKAKIVTTQADKLDESYIGKEITQELIDNLPEGIDVCGENGEFHTFVYAGNLFKNEIDFEIKEAYKLSFDIKLDSGEVSTYEYWQAKFR
ncbi:diphthine--ammonia ligase [Brumimicrobium glaciale]|uniref:Diphthine--ammonia ligase n=1 Tax=Brumimicrobium glaciale TaxID=200475 RepID=A0A4V1WFI2_9FLAO|nr:diphthine--ammonia ligase [Brumimicrobium glaciale]RYM33286.1 diphthine--ammonia ligase [Brumimicrobium glaciale]